MKQKNTRILELFHSGIRGMHWGERRYQYEDGRLTPLGKIHYGYKSGSTSVYVPSRYKYVDKKSLTNLNNARSLANVISRDVANSSADSYERLINDNRLYGQRAEETLGLMQKQARFDESHMRDTITKGHDWTQNSNCMLRDARRAIDAYGLQAGRAEGLKKGMNQWMIAHPYDTIPWKQYLNTKKGWAYGKD